MLEVELGSGDAGGGLFGSGRRDATGLAGQRIELVNLILCGFPDNDKPLGKTGRVAGADNISQRRIGRRPKLVNAG